MFLEVEVERNMGVKIQVFLKMFMCGYFSYAWKSKDEEQTSV